MFICIISLGLMRLLNAAIALLFGASFHLACPPPADAQGMHGKPSVCDDTRHPANFLVAGRYFHINRGTEDIAGARFQIKAPGGEVVSHAEAGPNYTFEALIPWRYCTQTLQIETIDGNRFSIAREMQISPREELLDFYGKRVIRLVIPLVEGKRGASLGMRTYAFQILHSNFESLLAAYSERFGSRFCCPAPQAEEVFAALVGIFDQADSLLADSERNRRQYVGMARAMAEVIVRAKGRSDIVPAAWVVRLQDFVEDAKFGELLALEKARLTRELAWSASVLVSGVSKAGKDPDSLSRLRQIASEVVRDSATSSLLRELASNPKNFAEMWSLTKEGGIALVSIEGEATGALDLYGTFFEAAPINDNLIPLESRRKIAVQSAIYFGRYLDIFTKRGEMKSAEYLASIRSDPKKLAYWSEFAVWLKKNEIFFVGGTTEEARILKSYSAVANAVSQ